MQVVLGERLTPKAGADPSGLLSAYISSLALYAGSLRNSHEPYTSLDRGLSGVFERPRDEDAILEEMVNPSRINP